jgi:type I restriction enzyme M protein
MAAEKNGNGFAVLERRLWDAADQLWANSPLRPSEYSTPVLGLIFLRFADNAFTKAETELKGKGGGRRAVGKLDYQAKGVVYLPDEARFSRLLQLPESADIGKLLNEAMKAIERENEDLKDVLPKTYQRIDNATLVELLKIMSSIPLDLPGDSFGRIYEYFLGAFAMKEGQKGGGFFTPPSMVDLIVEVIEPYHGRLLDPAIGSGGMAVSSAKFLKNHRKNPSTEISIFGQERVVETIRLCKMNLAVHGLSGDIRQSNTYYEDVHDSVGRFDFVMANQAEREAVAAESEFQANLRHLQQINALEDIAAALRNQTLDDSPRRLDAWHLEQAHRNIASELRTLNWNLERNQLLNVR